MTDHVSMKDWLEKYDGTERISKGDVLEGEVISVNSDEILVNINFMADGIVAKTEIPEENPLAYAPGQKVSVYVIKVDDGEGNVRLSLTRAEGLIVWDELLEIFNQNKTFEIKIKEAVKGGVIAIYKTARIFVPASQLSIAYVSDLSDYVGSKLKVRLVECVPGDKKAVASHKVIELETRQVARKEFLSRVSIDDQLSGKVVRLASYGAFVDLGEIDGLIHVSQMSWRHVKHPSEVMKEGDVVDVIVVQVDRDSERVGLKLAKVMENPWDTIYTIYQVDDVVPAKITRVTQFGAFAELEEGIEGLIHISELSESHVSSVSEVVKVGDSVEVLILDIDADAQKIALSLKAVDSEPETDFAEFVDETDTKATLSDLFADKLKNLKL